MKKVVLGFLAKVLFILVLIFSAYYIFVLQPRIAQNRIVWDVKKLILDEKYALLQRRLAFVQLAKLNPTSSRYIYAKSRIYNDLEESEKKLDELQTSALPDLNSFFARHQNEYQEFIADRDSRQDEIRVLMDKDKKIIVEQKQFDEQVDKLFEYFPSNDFSSLNEDNDCTTVEKKAQTTQEGLRAIEQRVTELALTDTFDQTFQSLKEIELNCLSNPQKAEKARQDLISLIARLKTELFAKKMNLILNNQEYLTILAQETQLVTEFEDLYRTAENILIQ